MIANFLFMNPRLFEKSLCLIGRAIVPYKFSQGSFSWVMANAMYGFPTLIRVILSLSRAYISLVLDPCMDRLTRIWRRFIFVVIMLKVMYFQRVILLGVWCVVLHMTRSIQSIRNKYQRRSSVSKDPCNVGLCFIKYMIWIDQWRLAMFWPHAYSIFVWFFFLQE